MEKEAEMENENGKMVVSTKVVYNLAFWFYLKCLGYWKNNLQHGKGIFISSDKVKTQGRWEFGKLIDELIESQYYTKDAEKY